MPIDRDYVNAEDYAEALGISLSELVGLIKTGYYRGEERNGVWYVEPNPKLPKTSMGRLLGFILIPASIAAFSVLLGASDCAYDREVFVRVAKWSLGGGLIGLAAHLAAKLHQMPK